MKLDTLSENSIIIAPSYLHPFLRKKLLEHKNGVLNIAIFSLTTYLKRVTQKEYPSKQEILYTYRSILHKEIDLFPIFGYMFDSYEFLNTLYNFINELKIFHVCLDELPTQQTAHKELKQILEKLIHIDTEADHFRHVSSSLDDDLSHIYIQDIFFDTHEEEIKKVFLEKGAHLLELEKPQQEKHYLSAINKRQEIEACARIIIDQGINVNTCHISLCDTSYQPLIKQIFDRYQIPYTIVNEKSCNTVIENMILILQYIMNPSATTAFSLLKSPLFHITNFEALEEYLQLYQNDFDTPFVYIQQIDIHSKLLLETDIRKLKTLETKAEIARLESQQILQDLQATSIDESLEKAVHFLTKYADLRTKEERNDLQTIYQYFQDCHTYCHQYEDLSLLIDFLENNHGNNVIDHYQGVIIHSLTQLYPFGKDHFILGATQQHFPGFMSYGGIFDETYVQQTSFPALASRYDIFMQQIDKVLCLSPNTYVFYPIGNYEGKAYEAANEIEEWATKKATPYLFSHRYIKYDYPKTIQHSHALYLRKGQLHSSISSFELYARCPFAYFLRYGLSLQAFSAFQIDSNYVGNMNHFILEKIQKTYQKDYIHVDQTIIENIIAEEIHSLQSLFPRQKLVYQGLQTRLLDSMMQTLTRLKDFEENSLLTIHQNEYAFTQELPLANATILLHGKIDRIDVRSTKAIVFDYKSSARKLDENEVFKGLQLQLLTYAYIVKEQFKKDILGSFYISLKNENITYDAGKIQRRPIEYSENSQERLHLIWQKEHKLSGWIFDEQISDADITGTHLQGLTKKKDGSFGIRKLYDFEKIETYIKEVYNIVAGQILTGNIALTPSEKACTFCKYHSICRFHGRFHQKDTLIEHEAIWKGGAS